LWWAALLSLALNSAGLTWGLPARWHPDEKADVAAKMAEGHGLAPDSFVNPSLPLYVMFGPVWLQERAARAGLLRGHAADPLWLARSLSALAGAAAVLVLGLAAWRAHPGLGAGPAFLLAVLPGFVNLCHFATPEPWLLLGTAATLAVAVAHVDGRAGATALGVALGLTASTKYTAAALLVPALAAVWLRDGDGRDRGGPVWLGALGLATVSLGLALVAGGDVALAARLRLDDARLLHPESALRFTRRMGVAALVLGSLAVAAAALARMGRPWAARAARRQTTVLIGAAAAAFVAGSPYVLLDPLAFLSALAFNDQTRFEYKGLTGSGTSFGPYLRLLAEGATGPVLLASGAGLLVAAGRALRRDRAAAVVALGAVAPYVLVAASAHQALRFVAPVLPPAAWLAALGLSALPGLRARRAASALVLARAAIGAVLVVRLFHVDARRQATRWIERNVPPGATVDVISNLPGYAPTMPPGRTLRVVPTLSREMAPADRFAEAAARYPAEASPWLILTASYYERFLDHPDQRPERAAFFRALLEGRAGFEIAARFRQEGWKRPPAEFLDPEIVILRRWEPARAIPRDDAR
jgi:hypothetical protein